MHACCCYCCCVSWSTGREGHHQLKSALRPNSNPIRDQPYIPMDSFRGGWFCLGRTGMQHVIGETIDSRPKPGFTAVRDCRRRYTQGRQERCGYGDRLLGYPWPDRESIHHEEQSSTSYIHRVRGLAKTRSRSPPFTIVAETERSRMPYPPYHLS